MGVWEEGERSGGGVRSAAGADGDAPEVGACESAGGARPKAPALVRHHCADSPHTGHVTYVFLPKSKLHSDST